MNETQVTFKSRVQFSTQRGSKTEKNDKAQKNNNNNSSNKNNKHALLLHKVYNDVKMGADWLILNFN